MVREQFPSTEPVEISAETTACSLLKLKKKSPRDWMSFVELIGEDEYLRVLNAADTNTPLLVSQYIRGEILRIQRTVQKGSSELSDDFPPQGWMHQFHSVYPGLPRLILARHLVEKLNIPYSVQYVYRSLVEKTDVVQQAKLAMYTDELWDFFTEVQSNPIVQGKVYVDVKKLYEFLLEEGYKSTSIDRLLGKSFRRSYHRTCHHVNPSYTGLTAETWGKLQKKFDLLRFAISFMSE